MSRIYPIFSGSTGNCTYITGKSGGILVDAGGSFKKIAEELVKFDIPMTDIKAIAVTHRHFDHIKGIRPLLNKLNIPLIASRETIEGLIDENKIPSKAELLPIDSIVEVDGILVSAFKTSHDSLGSLGFCFSMPDNKKISLCTDLGIVTDEVRNAIKHSNAVLIESNHDIEMLKKGPYPAELKVRIMSETGHISNLACAAELPFLLENGTTRFILGHLSQNNNTPMLARSTAESVLMDKGAKNKQDYILTVAGPTNNGVTVV